MKLHLVQDANGDPIVWSHKSVPATLGGKVSVMGILPFILLLIMPYSWVFWPVLTNFVLDIYKTHKRANRWADIIRRFRFPLNGGYWYVQSHHQGRQTRRLWDEFKSTLH